MRQIIPDESFIIKESFARLNALSWVYYDIAENAYTNFIREEENPIPEAAQDEDPTEEIEQINRKRVAGIKTIVFSAMCLEAAAFDFAAIQISDSYANQYLDKLDLISKWVVVPKLVCGKSLKENGPALNALRVLVRSRNALVHQKSLAFDPEEINPEAIKKSSREFLANVHNAFKAIVLLSLELDDLLGIRVAVLPCFEKNVLSSRKPSVQVKKVIERCRVIHKQKKR